MCLCIYVFMCLCGDMVMFGCLVVFNIFSFVVFVFCKI